MLDIRRIRDDPEAVKRGAAAKREAMTRPRRRCAGQVARPAVTAVVVSSACFVVCLVLCEKIRAYPVGPFDAKRLLDSADLVCHGQVVSIRTQEAGNGPGGDRGPPTVGVVAKVRVVNLIKGRADAEIAVAFRKLDINRLGADGTGRGPPTQLSENEQSILFLRASEGRYRFVDDHNGKLRIPPHKPLRYESESAEGRMVEELVYATRMDTGPLRLVCTEQLGHFRNEAAAAWLKVLATFKDMAVQGVAYAALIRLDLPPAAGELARFFERDKDTRSLRRFGTTGYSNGHLKGEILIRLHGRFSVVCRDFDLRYTGKEYVARRGAARAAARRWKDFDLIGFLDSAPWQDRDTRSVIDNQIIADILKDQIDTEGRPAFIGKTCREGSRRIAVGLLRSENRHVRFAAARAIDVMIAEPHDFRYPQKGRAAGTDAYVSACRDWLAGHPEWAEGDRQRGEKANERF